MATPSRPSSPFPTPFPLNRSSPRHLRLLPLLARHLQAPPIRLRQRPSLRQLILPPSLPRRRLLPHHLQAKFSINENDTLRDQLSRFHRQGPPLRLHRLSISPESSLAPALHPRSLRLALVSDTRPPADRPSRRNPSSVASRKFAAA